MSTYAGMSDSDLLVAARRYDLGMNEGGEGYNPYTDELDRRDLAAERARPRSRVEQIDALRHRLLMRGGPAARECGICDEAEIAAIEAEIQQLQAEDDADFLASWPLALTQERRAAWNAWVRTVGTTGRVPAAFVDRQVKAQGWQLEDLRRAIKLHLL